MAEEDYLLALELQKEFNREFEDNEKRDVVPVEIKTNKQAPKRKWSNEFYKDLNSTCNLVHPEWETLDPTPDVHSMFVAFDNKFFQGRLKCVTLEWSKKMYSCAGICYSRKCSLGMSITIRISEPLLKLRPRKDLVETLLHEMIHAYCFVLNIREGNGGHGPYFKKIMYGINKVAGTNITVYHTFYDEVDMYKIHWWRCNGICQNRKPFLGFVKRSCNRPPGPSDFWWQQHVQSCGGSFLKVKGPEPKHKKPVKDEISKNSIDISNYFIKNNTDTFNKPKNNNGLKGPIKMNGGGTLVLNPNNKAPVLSTKPLGSSTPTKPCTNGGNLKNVVGLKDLGESDSLGSDSPRNLNNRKQPTYGMNGKGYSLNGNNSNSFNTLGDGTVDLTKLRDTWSKKYTSSSQNSPISTTEPIVIGSPIKVNTVEQKRRRISTETQWKNVNGDNNDLIVLDKKPELIYLSSDDESDYITPSTSSGTETKIKLTQEERQTQIKKEIIDYTDILEDEIELIDDEYDDNLLNTSTELADTSLVDDLFGEDTLLKSFRNENSVIPSCSRYHDDQRYDIVECPICQEKIKRENFEEHLDGCVGISIKINPKTKQINKKDAEKDKAKKFAEVLKRAGYTNEDILKVINDEFIPVNRSSSSTSSVPNLSEITGFEDINHIDEPVMQNCPVCTKKFTVREINDHLDNCLENYQP